MNAPMTKSPTRYIGGFAVTGILSWLTLTLFPFYPTQVTIVLALALGIIGVKSTRIGLMLALLFTLIAAMYQGEFVGLSFFIVLVLASGLESWALASLVLSWVLALLTPFPALAIIPTVAGGLYERQGDALRLGVVSGVTIFLLGWMRSISRAGLILVSTTSSYVAKSVPSPWYFTLFAPNVDTFTIDGVSNYYAPLFTNLNDYRVYLALIAWSLAGYITAVFVSGGKKNPRYFASTLIGVLPALTVGVIFIKTPLPQVAAVLVSAAVLPFVFMPIQSKIALRSKGPVRTPVVVTTKPSDGRQLEVIMFTDVAGYTVLAKENAAAALKLLDDQKEITRPVLEAHKGREVKATGDTRVIEFTNALDALNCAVEMQTALQKVTINGKEMKIRIGLHLGDVIHSGNDVLGEAVNIASRIEILAAPGGICISRQVYDQVWNQVDYELTALAPNELKSIQYPAEVYRVSSKRTGGNKTGNDVPG